MIVGRADPAELETGAPTRVAARKTCEEIVDFGHRGRAETGSGLSRVSEAGMPRLIVTYLRVARPTPCC